MAAAPVGQLAEWGPRVVGMLIDQGIPLAVVILCGLVIFADPTVGVILVTLAYLGWLGFAIWNRMIQQGKTGQSIGKKVMKIRLVGETTGQPIGAGNAFVREIAHALEFIIGYLWPLFDDKKQTFADKLLHTVVVKAAPAGPGAPAGFGQPGMPQAYGQPGMPPPGFPQFPQQGPPPGYGQPGMPPQAPPPGYGQPGMPPQAPPPGYGQPGMPPQAPPPGYGQMPPQYGGFGQPGMPQSSPAGGFPQQPPSGGFPQPGMPQGPPSGGFPQQSPYGDYYQQGQQAGYGQQPPYQG
ncbi:MAG: RDD family protein [Actinophytocola sp.]|nr:RDD family protein [Actinophytocola sp.]